MENHHEDINHRIRMNLLKCKRYKTLREDPPNKKYLLREGYDSLHKVKILSDDNDDLNKALQVQVPARGVNIKKDKKDIAKEKEQLAKEKKRIAKEKERLAKEKKRLAKEKQRAAKEHVGKGKEHAAKDKEHVAKAKKNVTKDKEVAEDAEETESVTEEEAAFEIEEESESEYELEYEYEETPQEKKLAELAGDKKVGAEKKVADGIVADGKVADGKVVDGKVVDGKVAGGKVAGGKVAGGNVADGNVAKDKNGAEKTGAAVEREEKSEADEKKEAERKAKDLDVKVKAYTGGFRDGIKRIDIVLVVEDDEFSDSDSLMLNFLSNILKIGLEIEIEPGQMELHKRLCFIKIHAPDSVLKEYGDMFAVKRYFVDSRMASSKGSLEMEWLKVMRSNYTTPDGYSNYERSLIVYKILRHLPFGEHVNQYGLHLLIKRNIILDAYALHDGPYFYIPNQSAAGANGRQILFYNWVGLQNVFKFQPLHVIHEYLGPKIAFYYAFYGLYNSALVIASVAGIISMRIPYYYKKEPNVFKKFACRKVDYPICPYCYQYSCHVRNISEFCGSLNFNHHLDHPYAVYYVLFMTWWALVFVTVWRRKEYLLNWMWEAGGRDSYYETSRRPEFKVDYENPRRSARTGLKYDESGIYKIIRISLSIIHTVVCLIASLALMHECRKFSRKTADVFIKRNTRKPVRYDYMYLALFQGFYTVFMSALEAAFHFLYYLIVEAENHRSYKDYEKSLVTKQFELSMLLIYPYICYYAWLEGANNAYYSVCRTASFSPILDLFAKFDRYLRTPWHQLNMKKGYQGPDCYSFCFPFTCIIEVSVLLVVVLLIKQVFLRLMFNHYRLMTDYNVTRKMNKNIPWWEREYRLSVFNDAKLTRKYMILAVQFSLVTFFVFAFPLAPLVVLLVNVWEMRHSARKILLASRRPLLIRSPGIGAWNNIFLFIAYVAIFTNALNLVLLSKMNLRIKLRPHASVSLTNYTFAYLYTYSQLLKSEVLRHKECRAPYLMYQPEIHGMNPYTYEFIKEEYATRPDYYLIQFISFRIFTQFLISSLFFGLVIQYVFRPYRRDVEKTRAIEDKIKNLYAHYEFVKNNSGDDTDLNKSLLNDKMGI